MWSKPTLFQQAKSIEKNIENEANIDKINLENPCQLRKIYKKQY